MGRRGHLRPAQGLLRQLLREKEGRGGEPSACVIDAQSVKTSTSVHAAGQGIDAGKKIVGRERSIVTDTLGLLLAVLVTAASVQDSDAGTRLLDQVAAEHPTVRKVGVDGGYRQHVVKHAATLGIDMEITVRRPESRGFTPIPKRWAVERTYGWLMLHRRLARDYETPPTRSGALINLAMTDLMARRLADENTLSWRDPAKTTKRPIPDETSDENDLSASASRLALIPAPNDELSSIRAWGRVRSLRAAEIRRPRPPGAGDGTKSRSGEHPGPRRPLAAEAGGARSDLARIAAPDGNPGGPDARRGRPRRPRLVADTAAWPMNLRPVPLGVSRQSSAFRGGVPCQGSPQAIAKRRDEGAPLTGRPDAEGR